MTIFTRISIFVFALLVFSTACTYTIKVKDGRTAHDRMQYNAAVPMLEKEYNRAKTRQERGKIAFLLGESLEKSGNNDKANQWFKTAYDNNYGPEALKAYAYSLKQAELYEQAGKTFKELGIEIGSPYEYRKEITACTVAQDWKKAEKKNGWSMVESTFNSPKNDFSPTLYHDGRLVFTSDRGNSTGEERYLWTGNDFMDLFIVEQGSASPQAFDLTVNTPAHQGTACFSKDFKDMYFVQAIPEGKYDDVYTKIYACTRNGAGWSPSTALNFQQEKVNYKHPALSPDGKRLYFASDDKEGWGGYDLYYVDLKEGIEKLWGEPKSVTRAINTGANELFPTFDGDTLYFASDGHTGMGGLDVFKTYPLSKTAWSPPQNLQAPVNSGADDFGFIVTKREKGSAVGALLAEGFVSSNRSDGKGGDDIWKWEQRVPPPPPPVPVDTVPPKPIVYRMVLEGYVLEKIFSETDNPNSTLLGRKPLGEASVQINVGAEKPKTITVGADGRFEIELEENTDYFFTANKAEYLSNSERFSTVGMGRDPKKPEQRYEVEIVLDKIYRNREIVLENIYYDLDKADIRSDAEPTLNKLADILRKNPSVNIQLGSHTDCRGNDPYNMTLSQRRAESAVDFLIRAGISAERLSAKGYGESQPAADCSCARCSEAEHQMNRRTTFRIL